MKQIAKRITFHELLKQPDGTEVFKLTDQRAYLAALKDLLAAEVDIPGEQFEADVLIRGEVNSIETMEDLRNLLDKYFKR